jgi:regulator of sirC expression with transglutaminase-like and TPR domain
MLSQRDSIIRLLSDEDTETAELVEKQLIARGAEILPELRELAASSSGRVERRLREAMCEIERGVAETRVFQLCTAFHDESDIEEAAWAIASAIRPGEDFGEARSLLDEWAGILKARLSDAETVDDQAEIISDLLGGQMFLRGNEDDYYNVENSLLPNVIESRLGIPLTVTLVYIFVAKRAGLRVEGVGLPGHFIARIGHAFLDPFHGGRRMHLDECRKLLRSQGSELQPHHLLPCAPRAILSRMLNNLLHIAVQEGDTEHAKLVQGWLKALQKGGD